LCSPGSGTNIIWKQVEKEVMLYSKKVTTTGEWLKMGWNSLFGKFGSNAAYRKLFKQVIINYHKGYKVDGPDNEILKKINAEPVNKTRKQIIMYPPLKKYNKSEFPILITYGDNDIYGNSKNEVYDRFPSAQIKIIPGSGHIPWKHNPAEFINTLNVFYKL